MHRFFAPSELSRMESFDLPEREAHHAQHVLRVRPGERVTVLDGAGSELLCEVVEGGRDCVRVRVHQRNRMALPRCEVTLIQAVPKGKTFDLIVEKATELGAHRIVPVLSERSVPHFDADSGTAKVAKWTATAMDAIKQCGLPWLPRIETPVGLGAYLGRQERFDLALLASLQPGARHPRERVEAYCAERGRLPKTLAVYVGPEGDFTPAELAAIQGAGAQPVTLGPLVLRSETAAIYALSVLSYETHAPRSGAGPG